MTHWDSSNPIYCEDPVYEELERRQLIETLRRVRTERTGPYTAVWDIGAGDPTRFPMVAPGVDVVRFDKVPRTRGVLPWDIRARCEIPRSSLNTILFVCRVIHNIPPEERALALRNVLVCGDVLILTEPCQDHRARLQRQRKNPLPPPPRNAYPGLREEDIEAVLDEGWKIVEDRPVAASYIAHSRLCADPPIKFGDPRAWVFPELGRAALEKLDPLLFYRTLVFVKG